jgi:hypothetical protein
MKRSVISNPSSRRRWVEKITIVNLQAFSIKPGSILQLVWQTPLNDQMKARLFHAEIKGGQNQRGSALDIGQNLADSLF